LAKKINNCKRLFLKELPDGGFFFAHIFFENKVHKFCASIFAGNIQSIFYMRPIFSNPDFF